ncbi:sensor histidine kinase [Paenibacillus tarimensis]
MFRSFSIQLKLIVAVSFITVIMTGLIVTFHGLDLQQSVRQTMFSQLTGISTAINARYEESHSIYDVQQMFDYIQLRDSNVLDLTLHKIDGKIHASTDRSKLGTDSPDYVERTLTESKAFVQRQPARDGLSPVRLMAPLFEDGATVGVVELVLNASREEVLIGQKVKTAIVIALLCSAAFLIIFWFVLQRIIIKPLYKLRQAAVAVQLGARRHKVEMRASSEITEVADAFNDMVEKLDQRYEELQQALIILQSTQEQLVQAEKMSALGRLVAGVAHEINTPIGIGVTAISYLEERVKEFAGLYGQGRMRKSDLESFIASSLESVRIVHSNLERAAELVKSFKQVSVDQANESKRSFLIVDYIEDTLRSLQPTIKKTRQQAVVLGDRTLEVYTYPGAVSQIVTNLVMNSLFHAYRPEDEGYMLIRIESAKDRFIIRYADDGKGMPDEVLDKIFDPFFTTNRSNGGSGLGMNIVYNLVTRQLGGAIKAFSSPGRGTVFIMEFPFLQEEAHELQSA